MKCWAVESGYAAIPREEDTPSPIPPLQAQSREEPDRPRKQAWEVAVLLEARQEPQSGSQVPHPCCAGLASQLPLQLAPGGGFRGSNCGAEKGMHPTPVTPCLDHAREAEGAHSSFDQGRHVPLSRNSHKAHKKHKTQKRASSPRTRLRPAGGVGTLTPAFYTTVVNTG